MQALVTKLTTRCARQERLTAAAFMVLNNVTPASPTTELAATRNFAQKVSCCALSINWCYSHALTPSHINTCSKALS